MKKDSDECWINRAIEIKKTLKPHDKWEDDETDKNHEPLNPKLLIFSKNLIKKNPKNKKQINQVIIFLKKELKEEIYAPNPPYEWTLEYHEENYAIYTNGILLISLKIKKDKYIVIFEPIPFTTNKKPLKFPINKKYYSYKNVFDALGKIEEIHIWFEDMCREPLRKHDFNKNNDHTIINVKCAKCGKNFETIIKKSRIKHGLKNDTFFCGCELNE